jgi:DNA-binding IclR family transcriptional regulator
MAETGIKTIRAVERAADVLWCLGRGRRALSVTDMQKALGLSRPTLYRLLHTLESKGLVRGQGAPQRFSLGHRVVELASAWLSTVDVAAIAAPFLTDLWEATDETVALFVPGDGGIKICVQELPSRQPLVFTRGAGFSESMTIGVSGRVMLAHGPAHQVAAALAELDDAPARRAFEADLARIRRDGSFVASGEIIAGAITMAAPVFDRHGAVAAAICLFGPEARIAGETRARCLARLSAAAAAISKALGHGSGAGGVAAE